MRLLICLHIAEAKSAIGRVVVGWADDDSELGFIQGRIAAVAADAKRARARFGSASG